MVVVDDVDVLAGIVVVVDAAVVEVLAAAAVVVVVSPSPAPHAEANIATTTASMIRRDIGLSPFAGITALNALTPS